MGAAIRACPYRRVEMEKTGSRVAMGLMCGLAICCAVMYITADGADVQETILAPAKSVYGIGGPTSVSSEDVEKVGTVFTNTPDGRMRLTDYLTNVEKEIAAEEAARKRDVSAVRAQMARNFAFNKAARSKLKKALLHKMAVNAKKAKDDLDTGMRYVQGKFAAMAKLQNERNKANIARSKHIRAVVEANKKEAKKNLETQVLTQQRAMATLASAVNARIAKTNKHVAINAAQIKENAKKAREELDKAVAIFDKKAANARAEAAAGRSKLAAQLEAQDKSIRQWANNKMKVVMAATAAKFRRVREKMAADRHAADLALKAASTQMTASLNAFKALNDERFAKTVKDIAAAKAEAKARVAAAKVSFKTHLYALAATVKDQVHKTNLRIDQLSNTVTKNKAAQAKINSNVNAEMNRMVTLGNKRYQEHRATMNKNRAHATHMLAKESAKLYSAIEKSERAQMETNKQLAEQTRRARLDIEDSLRSAKDDFAERIGALHKTVVHNDKKFEGKMDKLTGIVRADAVKNANGRAELKSMMDANKKELQAAVRGAIAKGEARMSAAEKKLTSMNKKTKDALNLKITTEISALTKRANSQIEGLRLNSAEARKEMKKELLYAVRSMADEAKKNLDDATKVAQAAFVKVNAREAAAAEKSAAGRAAIAASIKLEAANAKQELGDAVATMQRSLLVLQTQTRKKIKKTNKRVTAYADALKKEASDVDALMKDQMKFLTGKIEAQKKAASADIAAADAKSAAGFAAASDAVTAAMKAAAEASSKKFGEAYEKMGEQRAALADSRFKKTVKDIKAAREEAATQVKTARKDFATDLAVLTAEIKSMETRLHGDIQVVAGEVVSHKAAQAVVNRHTKSELERIEKLMNDRKSESKKARGKLRQILDENKRAAAEEVKALDGLFKTKIAKIRSQAASDSVAAKKDLTAATEALYDKMAKIQTEQLYENQVAAKKIGEYSATQLAAVAGAKKDFNNRLDTLANTIGANHKTVEKGLEVLPGVIRDYEKAGADDRALIKKQNAAMGADMQKAITRAIQEGEAKAKAVAQRAQEHLANAKQSMLVEITNPVENMADKTFKTIQGSHQKIADNYLSLKAYAVTASDKLEDYVMKGKGKNLSSLGDLLMNIAALSSVKPQKAEGISASSTLPEVFSGGVVKVDNSISKINGLTNKLNDFEGLAVRMGHYEATLAKLTAALSGKVTKPKPPVYAKPPQWEGN